MAQFNVPTGAAIGTYLVEYQICEAGGITNCTTAIATIVIETDPVLTLVKVVVNDHAGAATITDWVLDASLAGTSILNGTSGVTGAVSSGDYVLSETGGSPSGPVQYALTSLVCDEGTLVGSTLTLIPNDVAICTFTNDDIEIVADLSITKVDLGTTYTPGGSFSYTITVTNNGPDAADGAAVADVLEAWAINPIWTCTASGGAVCPDPGPSNGSINETIGTFPNGGQLVYVLEGTYSTNMAHY